MDRTRVHLAVSLDLDPVPGTFHDEEDACSQVQRILTESIPHYNPAVAVQPKPTKEDLNREISMRRMRVRMFEEEIELFVEELKKLEAEEQIESQR